MQIEVMTSKDPSRVYKNVTHNSLVLDQNPLSEFSLGILFLALGTGMVACVVANRARAGLAMQKDDKEGRQTLFERS